MSQHGAGRRTRAGICGALAALLACAPAAALPPTQDPVTVTSRRIPEDLDAVPAAVSAVQRDDIQQGRQQLALDEALVRVPGLFVQDRTNFAQDLRISSRGFGARANFGVRGLKVYVDGIPVTLPDGQAQIDSVDLGSTERIEVMRGPASSLYGAAAGGVIQIFSEDGPEEPFAEGRFTAGEFGFLQGQLEAGGQTGPLDYLLSLSHREWDGYRAQSASRRSLLNAKLRWDIDPSSDLAVVVNAVHSPRADDPGGLTRAQVRSDRRQASPANQAFDAGEELDQQRIGIALPQVLRRTAHAQPAQLLPAARLPEPAAVPGRRDRGPRPPLPGGRAPVRLHRKVSGPRPALGGGRRRGRPARRPPALRQPLRLPRRADPRPGRGRHRDRGLPPEPDASWGGTWSSPPACATTGWPSGWTIASRPTATTPGAAPSTS